MYYLLVCHFLKVSSDIDEQAVGCRRKKMMPGELVAAVRVYRLIAIWRNNQALRYMRVRSLY